MLHNSLRNTVKRVNAGRFNAFRTFLSRTMRNGVKNDRFATFTLTDAEIVKPASINGFRSHRKMRFQNAFFSQKFTPWVIIPKNNHVRKTKKKRSSCLRKVMHEQGLTWNNRLTDDIV